MKRRLILLNAVLLALTAALFWQLRLRWLEGQARELQVLKQPAARAVSTPPAAPGAPPAAQSAGYLEVAQKTLFSKDRNPDVVVEVAVPKAVPPFPVAYGVSIMGDKAAVNLREKQGERSKWYMPGDKVGEFVLASVERDGIVLEWDGREFRKKLRDLKPESETAAAPVAAPAAAAPAAVTVTPTTVASTPAPAAGPGNETRPGMRECTGDNLPAGTIRDGYRKVLIPSPFGDMCRWDLVQ
jgi:hypothetical protein